MQVIDLLTTGAPHVNLNAISTSHFQVLGHLLNSANKAGSLSVLKVVQRINMLLRHHQHMHPGFRINVFKSGVIVILPDKIRVISH